MCCSYVCSMFAIWEIKKINAMEVEGTEQLALNVVLEFGLKEQERRK